MIILKHTQNGNITINSSVIAKIVLKEINLMDDCFILCNKKGKLFRKNILSDEYYNLSAVEVIGRSGIEINIYCFIKPGDYLEEKSDILFDNIETHLASVNIPRPSVLRIICKGIYGQPFLGDEQEVLRRYE